MNTLSNVFDEVFYLGSHRVIPHGFEPDLIAAAQSGNETALTTLIYGYAPLLRKVFAEYGTVERDEAYSALSEGLWQALAGSDGTSLASTLPYALREALSATAAEHNLYAVPSRTLRRFFSIMRKAGGDVNDAVVMASSFGMAAQTFMDVWRAVTDVESLDVLLDYDDEERTNYLEVNCVSITTSEPLGEDDSYLLEIAWDAVDEQEETVCRMAYGFTEADPLPDAEIGHRLGISRSKTQRVRAGALKQMREALGVLEEAPEAVPANV